MPSATKNEDPKLSRPQAPDKGVLCHPAQRGETEQIVWLANGGTPIYPPSSSSVVGKLKEEPTLQWCLSLPLDFIGLKRHNLHHLGVPFSEEAVAVGWAIMDTLNDRAPGSDGSSDWFFKVTWSIIKAELLKVHNQPIITFVEKTVMLKRLRTSGILASFTMLPSLFSILLLRLFQDFKFLFCVN